MSKPGGAGWPQPWGRTCGRGRGDGLVAAAVETWGRGARKGAGRSTEGVRGSSGGTCQQRVLRAGTQGLTGPSGGDGPPFADGEMEAQGDEVTGLASAGSTGTRWPSVS